ncbi:MAG: hypothetical protein ACYDCO_10770 [Armatimonadota bacterium]
MSCYTSADGTSPCSRISRRWSILAAILTVLVVTPLDGSALNVALPVLQGEFGVTLGQVAWVVLAYLVVIGSMIMALGPAIVTAPCATALLATMRYLGMAFGIAASSAVVSLGRHYFTAVCHLPASDALLHAVRLGFLVGAGFVLLGAITSAVREDCTPAAAGPLP